MELATRTGTTAETCKGGEASLVDMYIAGGYPIEIIVLKSVLGWGWGRGPPNHGIVPGYLSKSQSLPRTTSFSMLLLSHVYLVQYTALMMCTFTSKNQMI